MIEVTALLAWPFLLAGAFFFIAGTLGVLRFPDIYSRLHAVTKADTLGLGLTVIGLGLLSGSLRTTVLMILVWLLVLASGATACQLLARYEQERQQKAGEDDRR